MAAVPGQRLQRAGPAPKPTARARAQISRPSDVREPAGATAPTPTARPPGPNGHATFPSCSWRRRPHQGVSHRQADRQGSRAGPLRSERIRARWADRQEGRRGGSRRRGRHPGRSAAAGRGARRAGCARGAHARRRREAGDGQGTGPGGRAHQAPADGGPAHGRVEGNRAALLPAGRDRHDGGRRWTVDAEGIREGGRAGADLQRHGRQGVRTGTGRVPSRQWRLPRREDRALLADQRRGGGGGAGCAGRADGLRRRPQGAAPDLDARRGRLRHGSAMGRSRRPSSPAAPSQSPTWACTGSRTSTR